MLFIWLITRLNASITIWWYALYEASTNTFISASSVICASPHTLTPTIRLRSELRQRIGRWSWCRSSNVANCSLFSVICLLRLSPHAHGHMFLL